MASANLDDFMIYADKHGQLLPVMGEYYAYRSLAFFDRTSGILTLDRGDVHRSPGSSGTTS